MTATETETMVTLIKTEPNIDDYEWISEASEEEYQIKERIKFEVVQENSSSSEDPSPLSSIRDEETSSNAPSSRDRTLPLFPVLFGRDPFLCLQTPRRLRGRCGVQCALSTVPYYLIARTDGRRF